MSLPQALKFLKSSGSKYCKFKDQKVYAQNEKITFCHPIDESFEGIAKIDDFIKALKIDETLAFVQLQDALQVKTDDLQIFIGSEELVFNDVYPDILAFELSDVFFDILKVVSKLSKTSGETKEECSILNHNGSLFSTNRKAILQGFHGLELPGFILPTREARILQKVKERPSGLGLSETSVTFHWDSGAWVHLELIQWPWRDLQDALECSEYSEIPEGFKEALSAVLPFCEDEIQIGPSFVGNEKAKRNFTIDCDSKYCADELSMLLPLMEKIYLGKDKFGFIGGPFRGVVTSITESEEV